MVQIIIVEGNISVGKSTILPVIETMLKLQNYSVISIPEPVRFWQREFPVDILNEFYTGQITAFEFQLIVGHTIAKQMYAALSKNVDFIIFERTIWTCLKIFSQQLCDDGKLSSKQLDIIKTLSRMTTIDLSEILHPVVIVYLTCPLDVTISRLENRNRNGEQNISLEYLENLSCRYENWFKQQFHPFNAKHILKIDTSDDFISTSNIIYTKLFELLKK